jgi:DNA-binding NarL/FixJ family response regulator
VGASLAALYLLQGRVQSAHLQARSSYLLFRELGSPFAARWSYGAAALALALTGMSEKASDVLADLDELHLPPNLLIETDILLARGWTAVAAGDVSIGRQYIESAVDMGQEVGDLIGATRALHSLARLGRARQVTSRLTALSGEIDSDLVAMCAKFTSAFATRSSGALEAVASNLEAGGSFLLSAEALGEAAFLLRRDGYSQEAGNAEQRGRRLLARCEGAVTPLVHAIGARGHLTPAEWETAMQAITGSSDKEIATRMNLSVRTIENRLHRTYQKLGLTRRHELADALRDMPHV